jgi:ubiquinone/menaquinone biosynthesis C-methylase UbiE
MSKSTQTMLDYCSRRAEEFEQVYTKLERQANLVHLQGFLSKALAGQSVLEVACGTG